MNGYLKIGDDCFFMPLNKMLKRKKNNKKYEVHNLKVVNLVWNTPYIVNFSGRSFKTHPILAS